MKSFVSQQQLVGVMLMWRKIHRGEDADGLSQGSTRKNELTAGKESLDCSYGAMTDLYHTGNNDQ